MSRAAAILCLATLVAFTPLAAAQSGISFGTPAQANGDIEAAGLQWMLLYLGPAELRLADVRAAEVENRTFSMATLHLTDLGTSDVPAGWQPATTTSLPEPFSADLSFGATGPAALFIEAMSITFDGGPFRGQLVQVHAGDDAEAPLPGDSGSVAMQARPLASEGVGLGLRAPADLGAVQVRAEGLRRVEWFGARVTCPLRDCPEGGGEWNETIRTPRGDSVAVARLSWMDLRAKEGQIELAGFAWAVAGGGTSPDLLVRGDVRLPRADNPTPCQGCLLLEEETLTLTGEIALRRLVPLQERRLQADLAGTAIDARLDESRVDSDLLGLGLAPAAAAGLIAVGVAWKLLALFSRALRDPLANARRREAYDTIRANPGLAFRDLLRLTGMANGVAAHHVRALARHGLIVRQSVGNTVRLFENHGRYDRDWRTVAALRDPDARLLHAWLKARGRCRQLDALQAAEGWGWSPTTTKRRLETLVKAGLAATAREGRVRWYAIPSASETGPAA